MFRPTDNNRRISQGSGPAPNPMLQELLQRVIRMETRLARLMLHMGLTVDGDPRTPAKKD